jgi:hypothetical protein
MLRATRSLRPHQPSCAAPSLFASPRRDHLQRFATAFISTAYCSFRFDAFRRFCFGFGVGTAANLAVRLLISAVRFSENPARSGSPVFSARTWDNAFRPVTFQD